MDKLSRDEQIRALAINAAVRGDKTFSSGAVVARARAFESYIKETRYLEDFKAESSEHTETSIVYDKLGNCVTSKDDYPVDLTGYTIAMPGKIAHVHLPRQHRDKKLPWCDNCGLTKELLVPKSGFDRGDKPTVHQEPDCVMNNELCTYPEPHKHGFACDKTCPECHGKCHKDCPAHDEYYGINPGIPKPISLRPQHEFVPSASDLLYCADCELPRNVHTG